MLRAREQFLQLDKWLRKSASKILRRAQDEDEKALQLCPMDHQATATAKHEYEGLEIRILSS